MRIAINGFGRIGRCFFRAAMENNLFKEHELVALNTPGDTAISAHLLKYDSIHGKYNGRITFSETTMNVDGVDFNYYQERDPLNLPWKKLKVDLVVESTGVFNKRDDAAKHLVAGAKKVLLTAPGKPADVTIVPGVNEGALEAKHEVISMASCTTNCLAPMCKVLQDSFGIEKGFMSTVHAYTGDQQLLDSRHKDYRRARSAALSIIPTTTGAAKSIGLVMPELDGKLDGIALRVPTADSSLVDLTVELSKAATAKDINAAFKAASEGKLKGILAYTDEPIVSCDVTHDAHSCVFDSLETKVNGGKLAKVLGWYDNEWGYSSRLVDLIPLISRV